MGFFEPDAGLNAARMRELLANLSCPLSGGTRETSLLVVIDGSPESTAVRAQCVRCHLFWSFALDQELEATAEAGGRERHASTRPGPITADEIIDLHRLLDGSQVTLDELLERRAS